MSPQRLHNVLGAALAILVAIYLIVLGIVLPQADVKPSVYFGLIMTGIGAFSFCCGFLGSPILVRVGARMQRRAEGEPEA